MKKQIITILTVLCVLTFLAGCGKNGLSGEYSDEEGTYSISFTSDSECTWYQDGKFFNGTYRKTDSGYQLEIEGNGLYSNTVFNVEADGDDLIITGGVVDGLKFIKE